MSSVQCCRMIAVWVGFLSLHRCSGLSRPMERLCPTHVRIIPCAFTGWAQRMRLGGLEHLIPWDGSWTRGDARQGVSSSQTSSTSRLRHPFSKPPVHGACGSVCVHHGKQYRLTSSTPPIYIIPSAHPVCQSFLLSLLILQTKHSPYSPLPIFQFCELFFFFFLRSRHSFLSDNPTTNR